MNGWNPSLALLRTPLLLSRGQVNWGGVTANPCHVKQVVPCEKCILG